MDFFVLARFTAMKVSVFFNMSCVSSKVTTCFALGVFRCYVDICEFIKENLFKFSQATLGKDDLRPSRNILKAFFTLLPLVEFLDFLITTSVYTVCCANMALYQSCFENTFF